MTAGHEVGESTSVSLVKVGLLQPLLGQFLQEDVFFFFGGGKPAKVGLQ